EVDISNGLKSNIEREFITSNDIKTLIKKRYIQKDGVFLTKLFETYSSLQELLNQEQTDNIIQFLKQKGSSFDLVIVADFGNG
ncbi:hypothetical protein ABK046_50005, partial [Streptomyces caeruleatus]